jgi:NADH-quinone oxidoreductase subunit B
MKWSLTKPDVTSLVATPDLEPFEETVRRSVVLSQLNDLVAWGRKNSMWPFQLRALLLLRRDGHQHHQ